MANLDTTAIVKNRKISDSERKYGKGKDAKMYFAFRMILIFSFIVGALMVATIIGAIFIGVQDTLAIFGAVMPFASAPLTFMLGSLYGKSPENP